MPLNRLPPSTAAYIAGIVDGEGTVTLTRPHKSDNRRLLVCVSNNEVAILRFLKSSLGAGKITGKRIYSDRHRPSFTYQISSRQALELLRQIAPYMVSYKALRARLALELYIGLTPRNGKYTKELRAARDRFEAALLAIRP
jgi:hypothetical protein